MPDIVPPEKRSEMMAGIKGTNTKPELQIRSMLHHMGFRYRIHEKKLPGKPDLFFPKYKAVIFIHGCFWHGHDCTLFKIPSTNSEFWDKKISENKLRDNVQIAKLNELGYKVLTVWECSVRGKGTRFLTDIGEKISAWLANERNNLDIRDIEY